VAEWRKGNVPVPNKPKKAPKLIKEPKVQKKQLDLAAIQQEQLEIRKKIATFRTKTPEYRELVKRYKDLDKLAGTAWNYKKD
jgi:hypothetical protein